MGIKCSGNKKKNKNNNENEIKINLKKDEKNTNNVLKDGKQCDSNTSPDTPKKDTNENNDKKKKGETIINDLSKNETKTTYVVALDSNVFVTKGGRKPDEVYIKEKTLGSGSFGTVYLVKHKQLHRYFAMKAIKKTSKSKVDEEGLMNEINILRKMDHPNILKITDFYSQKNEYDIITEYCQEGELFNEIKQYAPFNETITGHYMKQILTAVCYCHGMNIVHRDLKPENILIVKRAKNGCHPIKIIDFGTAKVFSKEKSEHLLIGSAYYIAPEVLSRNYTEKCDIWSCGVIMYILLTGRPPFFGNTDSEIMYRIKSGKYDLSKYPWSVVSKEAKDLIKALLQPNPNMRLSAEQALKHPWFSSKKVKALDKLNNLSKNRTQKLVENLTKYKSDNILRCAVIAYLVHNNTQLSQAHDAIKLFNQIDENGDGKITREELYNGLQQYLKGQGDKLKDDVELIFNNIDTDHNGFIEYEEFIRAAIDKEYFLSNNFIKFAFNYFDRDKNGDVTFEEIKNLFCQSEKNKNNIFAIDQLKKSFEEIDVNNDGSLSFEEFVQMMKNIIEDN
jgi:calcium-dependent protein kinase